MAALSAVSHFAVAAAAIGGTLVLLDQRPWQSASVPPGPVPLCDGGLSFLAMMPRDAYRAVFGEENWAFPAMRSGFADRESGLLAVSFGRPVADSFALQSMNSRQSPAVPPFAGVQFDSMPRDLDTALRKVADEVSGERSYRPTVYFHASAEEDALSWPRVDAAFEPLLDYLLRPNAWWERFASAPSCYIARQRLDEEVFSVYAMSSAAGSAREQAQCYWTALQTAYGLSGVSYLYHRKPLRDDGDHYAADFFPQDLLYRRKPDDWGIDPGTYVLSGYLGACPDVLALTGEQES